MPYADPSVIQGYQPIELPDPGNMLLRALQIQGARGQNRLLDLQTQEKQQGMDRTNALLGAYQDPSYATADPATQQAMVMRADPINGPKLFQAQVDLQKAMSERDKLQQDLEHQHISRLASDVGAAAPSGRDAVIQAVNDASYLPADRRSKMSSALAGITDPAQFALRVKQLQTAGLTVEQQMTQNNPQILDTDQGVAAINKDGSGGRLVRNLGNASPSAANASPSNGPTLPPSVSSGGTSLASAPPGATGVDWERTLRASLDDADPSVRAEAQTRLQQMTPGLKSGWASGVSGTPNAGAPESSTIGGKPSGKWEHDPLNGNFVYLANRATPGQTAGSGGDAMISPAAIDNAAKRYNLDGTLPPMGMGVAGSQGRKQILDRAAELSQGTDGTDQRVNQMGFKADAAALSKLTAQQGAIASFEKTANSNAQMALDMSNKLDRTGVPIINAGLQYARTQTGSPEAAQFHAAVATFVGEYAKVMSGGTGSGPTSDAARAKASSLLTEGMTKDQFAGVVQTLQAEMANRMKGFDDQVSEIRGRMRGQSTSGSSGSGVTQSRLDELAAKYGGK